MTQKNVLENHICGSFLMDKTSGTSYCGLWGLMASEARHLTRTRQIEIVAIVADRLVKNEVSEE